jgi:hypothetical protein
MKPFVDNPAFTPENLRELQDLWIRRHAAEKYAEALAAATVKTETEPIVWSPCMTLKECAKTFRVSPRSLEEQLSTLGVRFERVGRQRIRVRVSDIPPKK